jgi:hypothetical protein
LDASVGHTDGIAIAQIDRQKAKIEYCIRVDKPASRPASRCSEPEQRRLLMTQRPSTNLFIDIDDPASPPDHPRPAQGGSTTNSVN